MNWLGSLDEIISRFDVSEILDIMVGSARIKKNTPMQITRNTM